MELKQDTKEQVGKFEMAVVPATEKEDDHHRKDRVQAIANWLLAQWEREQREAA